MCQSSDGSICGNREGFRIHGDGVGHALDTDTKNTPRSYRKVHELLDYINRNYYLEITSPGIEKEFSCNFDYMNKIFKKVTGKTIFVYLNEIRIRHACKLLTTTSMKVAAVSSRVGFRDVYYFSKVFKKYTGISPGQYEKMTIRLVEEQQKPS